MKITPIAKIIGGQDGAFFGDYLFRFNAKGKAMVFDATALPSAKEGEVLPLIARFSVNRDEPLLPHFNAVVFGNEYFAEGDEFPLLYANLYNNYSGETDRKEGILCAYRLQRRETEFTMSLVQVIRVGFVHDPSLWCSADVKDVRPFGNFVIDTEKNILYAFTMRDGEKKTRYFSFALPRLSDGILNEAYGVKTVTLEKEDVLSFFDTEYHAYIQGACFHEGRIYSSEGFSTTLPAALRIIDPVAKKQLAHFNLADMGYPEEAEWIDFKDGKCYYSDILGNLFLVDFEL